MLSWYFQTCMEPRNWCQGINSASLCSLAGRYDNPIPTRCLAPIDFLKIPALLMNLSRNAASHRNRGEKDRLPYMFPVNIKFSNIKFLDLYCITNIGNASIIYKIDTNIMIFWHATVRFIFLYKYPGDICVKSRFLCFSPKYSTVRVQYWISCKL